MEMSAPFAPFTLLWHAMQCSEVVNSRWLSGIAACAGPVAAPPSAAAKPVRIVINPVPADSMRTVLFLRIIFITG